MPWPFSRRMSGQDAVLATQVIRHLQTQMALQQLAMETYNYAVSMASSSVNPGDPVSVRGIAGIVDPRLVEKYLVPGAEKKVDIAEAMLEEHQVFQAVQKPGQTLQAYDKWTEFATIHLARARLQLATWREWVADPSLDLVDLAGRQSSLDQAEDSSMNAALEALNRLGRRLGIGERVPTSLTAINEVRSRIGLPELTESDFESRFYGALAGERARFYE